MYIEKLVLPVFQVLCLALSRVRSFFWQSHEVDQVTNKDFIGEGVKAQNVTCLGPELVAELGGKLTCFPKVLSSFLSSVAYSLALKPCRQ